MLGVGRLLVLAVLAAVLLNLIQNASATEYTCDSCSDCNSKVQATTSGDIVKLNTSITFESDNCIEFNDDDNIILDCDGFNISGEGDSIWWFGVYLGDSDNNIIRNCSISGFFDAVLLITSVNTTITNVIARNNTEGISIGDSSNYTKIVNVTATENDYMDVVINGGSGYHCNDILINVTGSGGRPIRYYNYSVNLANEVLSELILCNADYSNITNITVIGSESLENNAIDICKTDYSNFSMINSSHNEYGIYFGQSSNNSFADIVVNNNYHSGLIIGGVSYNNTFVNVTANYNPTYSGVGIYSSDNNTLVNVTANYNNYGVYSSYSNYINLSNFTLSGNTYGIYLYYRSQYNTIKNSRIENSTQHGISLVHWSTNYARYNTFYNNFLNNTINLNSTSSSNQNYWNTTLQTGQRIYAGGNNIGGNFWAFPNGTGYSQTCTDVAGDGICDNSYTILTNNVDYLPLSDQYQTKEIAACRLLNETGWTYNLTQDITNSGDTVCMNVTVDNVTLDCGGRSIDGASASDTYGVHMYERKNVTIINCTITDWWYGVYMNVTIRSNVSGNNLTNNNIGLETLNSLNNTMNDNFVKSTSAAIDLSNSSFNSINRNTIRNGDVGISLALISRNNTFTGNSLDTLNTYAVYIYQSYDNFFRDSNITSTSTDIYHFASTDTVFLNVSLDKSKITVDAGTIYLKWYLDARIVSEEGAVNQANVTIKDAYNTTLFSGASNASGYITRQNATEFHQNFSGKFYYNNHVINASRFGYVQNQTSANVTANQLVILYLPGIAPPLVQVKTYTLGMVETDIIKPGRIVRIRANVNHTLGREYIMNSTLAVKDNTGSLVLSNAAMANISNITNGYTYEYNYTLLNGSEGLWTVNVTAADSFGRKGSGFKKIAVIPLTLQIKLVLNSTSDSIYIPGTGETSFSGLATAEYASPEHYYLASYSGDALKAVVFSHLNPIALLTEKNADSYAIGTSQRFSSSMVFLAFSKGNWRIVNNRMSQIEKGEFLSAPKPSFGFGLGGKYSLKVFLSYQDIDINSTLVIGRGYNRLVIEKTGSTGAKARIDIERG